MQTTTLARYGGPIAIVAGALMIITRLVILFTTPAEIGPLKAYVLTPTHAVNSVVSILGFALLVIALVVLYDREARSAGAFGALAFGAAVIGTMFMTGGLVVRDLCGAALGGGRTRRRRHVRRGQADHWGSDQLRAVRHRLDHVRGGEHSGSSYSAKHLDHHHRGRPHVRRADRHRLPQRRGGSRAGVRLAGRMDAESSNRRSGVGGRTGEMSASTAPTDWLGLGPLTFALSGAPDDRGWAGCERWGIQGRPLLYRVRRHRRQAD